MLWRQEDRLGVRRRGASIADGGSRASPRPRVMFIVAQKGL